MNKKVSFADFTIVKTISTKCPNGNNCHDKECKKEHDKDTIYRGTHDIGKIKEVKEVQVLKSTKKQCPKKEKCKKLGCCDAHPWDTVF